MQDPYLVASKVSKDIQELKNQVFYTFWIPTVDIRAVDSFLNVLGCKWKSALPSMLTALFNRAASWGVNPKQLCFHSFSSEDGRIGKHQFRCNVQERPGCCVQDDWRTERRPSQSASVSCATERKSLDQLLRGGGNLGFPLDISVPLTTT